MAPLPADKKSLVDGTLLLVRGLAFLAFLLRDLAMLQARRKAASLDPSLITVSPPLSAYWCAMCEVCHLCHHRSPI